MLQRLFLNRLDARFTVISRRAKRPPGRGRNPPIRK